MLTLLTEIRKQTTQKNNNKMKTRVSTTSQAAAIEFEGFLRDWEVDFKFNEMRIGNIEFYTYSFDDQDDARAFKSEGQKAMGDNLFRELSWGNQVFSDDVHTTVDTLTILANHMKALENSEKSSDKTKALADKAGTLLHKALTATLKAIESAESEA